MLPGSDDIVHYVEQHAGLKTRSLADELGVPAGMFESFVGLLLDLQRAGRLVRVPRRGWELPERTDLRVGHLRLARRGRSTVRVGARGPLEEDLAVEGEDEAGAFTGDLVLVRVESGPRARVGKRRFLREARVIDVIERGRRLVRGRYVATPPRRGASRDGHGGGGRGGGRGGGGIVQPLGGKSAREIYIAPSSAGDATDGEEVLIRLIQGSGPDAQPRGKVVVRSQEEGTFSGDLRVVREIFDLPARHPPDALREARALEDVPEDKHWPGRVDLRGENIFTIDPEDSRDFDDAVSLESLGKGRVCLGVHIADVSHYASPGSALDLEAENRGTSIYLPGRVIPMLPERLSDDLASLRPGEDRLTKTVRMTFGPKGRVEGVEVFRSVIRSTRRFTYEEVFAIIEWIETGKASAGLPSDHAAYRKVIQAMGRLRDRLHAARKKRGSLDLNIPSLRLQLDGQGNVVGLGADARDPAHSLIEEFMLAANEAVARYLLLRKLPLLSRAHASPGEDKLEEFRTFLAVLGFQLPADAGSHDFQRLVAEVSDAPLSGVVQLGLLKTMEHAAYVAEAASHFALATDAYCHFTSPIRRYPDLVLHQLLDDQFDGRLERPARRKAWRDRLARVAEHALALERRAEEAEREMVRLRLIRYLKPFVGEEMKGRIVSVHPFGFFVRVDETLVEGMVPVGTLTDDYYDFDAGRLMLCGRRTEKRYAIGDPARVVLHNLDPDLREITFAVSGQVQDAGAGRAARAKRKGVRTFRGRRRS